jgi:hypothetical protein
MPPRLGLGRISGAAGAAVRSHPGFVPLPAAVAPTIPIAVPILSWQCQHDTSSDRTPLARMLPRVMGSIRSLRRAKSQLPFASNIMLAIELKRKPKRLPRHARRKPACERFPLGRCQDQHGRL